MKREKSIHKVLNNKLVLRDLEEAMLIIKGNSRRLLNRPNKPKAKSHIYFKRGLEGQERIKILILLRKPKIG